MMTDKDNWQEKPGEGENAARRDGEGNERSGNESTPWRRQGDGRSSQGSSDRPRRTYPDNKGGFNRGGNSFDRPRRSFGEGENDRPRRSFGEGGNDRPFRSGNNDGNSFRNNFDRPRSSSGEGDSDRPRRSYGEGGTDRPHRSFGEGGNDRPFRSGSNDGNSFKNNFDRPRRSFGESDSDRPRRSYGEGGTDRPRRSSGEGDSDRPRRSFGDSGNRFGGPAREGGFDRPRRSYGENTGERPRRSYGEGSGRATFSGPTLPKPERADGRPRRPRIKREASFDHGTPYGRPAGGYQQPLDPNEPIRLNKFLANAGICSRREADEFIQAGVVRVNGEIVTELGVKVKPIDTILFHDQQVSIERKVYILLNKPKDCVTTSDDPQERLTVMDLVKDACFERIYPVGRLDRNTTGVLLLTNDGDLASKLTHPKFEKRKIYQVTLDKNLTEADFKTILAGITLDDEEIKTDNLSYVDPDKLSVIGIEIHSGQNRVVRRIFESLGYKVFKLDRVYFAGLTKKNLPRGKWRHLTEKEVSLLKMGAFV